MSIGQNSTIEDPTDLTTTNPVEVVDRTTGSAMTSSSSRGAGFYFQCAVLVIGVVGAAVNALVLYGLVASRQHKKQATISLSQ